MNPGLTPSCPDHNSHAMSVYLNPIPAAVAIVPVYACNPDTGRKELGLLTIERGVPPQVGKLALPGGYIEQGEDWRQALLRELQEETGVRLEHAQCVTLKAAHSVDDNRKLVLFGSVPTIDESQLAQFVSHPECPRFEVIFKARELAFPTHTEMAQQFFNYIWVEHAKALFELNLPGGFRCSEK